MNVFLTGVTGFIGRSLLPQLQAALGDDDKLYVLVRRDYPCDDSRVIVLRGDLETIEAYRAELLDSDYVFHLGANATFGDDADYDRTNLDPVRKMADILDQSDRLKDLVFTSTIGAVDRAPDDDCAAPLNARSVPHPTSEYGRSKLRAEQCLRESGVPFTIFRATWVYGKHMRGNSHLNQFATMVCKGTPLVRLGFPGRVSLIHVDDLCAAMVACMDNPKVIGKVYFAEAESLSIGAIFKTIHEKVYNRKPFQIPVPRLRFLTGRLHSSLPLAATNLFLDYLCAKDDQFQQDLLPEKPRLFAESVGDILATNRLATGAWVITGANSGIGLALAHALHGQGRSLMLVDKNTDRLDKFDGQLVVKADLSDREDVAKVASRAGELNLGVLVNNAGVGYRKSFDAISPEEIETTLAVNVQAPVMLTKMLLPTLARQNSTIVNVGSSVAYHPLPGMEMYAASKAFLVIWSESLSEELKGDNTVITFSPSGTDTRFQEEAGVKREAKGKGLLQPEFVALQIIKAVRKERRIVIIGLKTKVLLLVARFLPRRVNAILFGKLFAAMR
jgi:uncharacterized protein